MTEVRTGPVLPLLALAACASVDAARRPNVVLVLADDVGIEAFGCYGGTSYDTPRLDALAAEGMRFTHVYSQTLCTPSRVKLLTGRSNLRNYVRFSILRPGERTLAHVARDAGYATAAAGKWQLLGADVYEEWAGRGTGPGEAGLDRWCLWQVGTLGSRYWDPTVEVDGELRPELEGEYGPDLFCEYLLDFVSEQRDEPFLAFYPMALVHAPFTHTPASAEGELSKEERFADMVAYMDAIVGRIEDRLDELGLREDTLLLFLSDNGTDRAIRSRMGEREVAGGKAHSTDAGTRVPLIASWPGKIAAGSVCDDLIDLSDFLPTLAEVMGAEPPGGLDGRSFLPQLQGREGDPRDVIAIYSNPRPPGTDRNPRVCFARDRRYKLYDDGRLFDTVLDPGEESPLDSTRPDAPTRSVLARLQRALDDLPDEPTHLRE